MLEKKPNAYQWNYCSLGGVVRVNIASGEDIAHLGELDQKLWTVLSSPTKNLEFPQETLNLLDADGDGRIKIGEVVDAANWLTSVIKDKDSILQGASVLPFSQFNTDNEKGKVLLESAKQILKNLGVEKEEISLEDTSDSVKIFAETAFNGDGIITAKSTSDEELQKLVTTISETVGSVTDRCGLQGVNEELIGKFYAELADYDAWKSAAEADAKTILPYGDGTAAALAAVDAIKDKVSDYYMRCKLIAFDDAVSAAVDVSVEKLAAITEKNLATQSEEISTYPLARPNKSAVLPFEGINPAWQAAFSALKSAVLDVECKGKKGVSEAEWNAILGKLEPYRAWVAGAKGLTVDGLGLDAVRAILKADKKAALLELVASDKALEGESASIDDVHKLLLFYRDFYKYLKNYVLFKDFYSPDAGELAVFEAGELYIDQRCCKLCVRVEDMGQHADIATKSGMFLVYCDCVSKTKGEKINIVAVMTAGNISRLYVGKNAIFYSRDGQVWDAVVTKIVDNPMSVRQAFWRPYKKLAQFISDKLDKSAADKDSAATTNLLASADKADPAAPKQPFDIAKYAGIFAAIGVAIGALGAGLGLIINGLKGLPWWQYFVIIAAIMLVISGPACFIAWRKLRRRNLGPVLNANGWAINSVVIVNSIFGKTLTSVAEYPHLKLEDPYKKKSPLWWRILRIVLLLAIIAFAVLFFMGKLDCIGLPFNK